MSPIFKRGQVSVASGVQLLRFPSSSSQPLYINRLSVHADSQMLKDDLSIHT